MTEEKKSPMMDGEKTLQERKESMKEKEPKTIASVAEEMYSNLVEGTRDNGNTYLYCEKSIEWQQDIIRGAHPNDRMPCDDVYQRINDILARLTELTPDDGEDEARDLLIEIEPDCYTASLTAWLAEDIRNVYFLNEAIEEYNCSDGFNALATAQKIYIEEIGYALISNIVEYIEEHDAEIDC